MRSTVHWSVRSFIHSFVYPNIYWNLTGMGTWTCPWGSQFFIFSFESVCRTHRTFTPVSPSEPVVRLRNQFSQGVKRKPSGRGSCWVKHWWHQSAYEGGFLQSLNTEPLFHVHLRLLQTEQEFILEMMRDGEKESPALYLLPTLGWPTCQLAARLSP